MEKQIVVHKGARAKIMKAILENGMLLTQELADNTGLTAKQARDNANAAKKDGLVETERDDVTGLLAYKLTTEGKKWAVNNLNGPSDPHEPQQGTPARQQEPKAPPACQDDAVIEESPAYAGYVIFGHDGDSDSDIFASLEKAKAAAIQRTDEVTIYQLVEVGRTVRQVVFVPA